jgi:IS5 family transposase
MLIIGYCYGIRSERRLCEEVHLNLAYRWFCRLGLAGEVPDHSTFSKNRHGRFRDSDLLRHVFEAVVRRCIAEGLVGGDGFAVDASLIRADASSRKGVEGTKGLAPEVSSRAVDEYLAVLDGAAFGAASEVTPKFISPADPAARWTGARGGQAFFAYCANYLIDLDHAVIVDVEASTAVRPAEVTRSGWPVTPPMDQPRCRGGWCMSAGSNPTCRCSTSPNEPMGRSRARTSPMITKGTSMSARPARF